MQITLLHYTAPPVVGGVESVLARQADVLVAAGHEVSVVAGRGQAWNPDVAVISLPRVDSLHPQVLELKYQLDEGAVPAGFASFSDQILADLRPALQGADVLIAHNVASLHKNLALTAALFRLSQEAGAPRFILWHHDLAWTAARYQDELHPGYPWDLLRSPWPGARQVTISETRREDLAALLDIDPAQIRVIPAGLDMAAFLNISQDTWETACSLGIDHLSPLLLAPVRITRRKNLELGLHVLAELSRTLPRAGYLVTGPTGAHNPENEAYLAELQDLRSSLHLEGRAHFLAELAPAGISDRSIAEWYRLADALLLTSLEEGFGIPVLEAGLGRLPVFCTRLPALESLAGGLATYFDPVDPPSGIAAAVAGYLSTDQAFRLRDQIRSRYTWEAVYEMHLKPLLETA